MRLLFLGDMVGKTGRTAVWERLPGLVSDLKLDFVIVNGENAAGGFGITEDIFLETINAGADVVTTGNHVWDQKEAISFSERHDQFLRPANYPAGAPGKGSGLFYARNGARVLVANVMGRVFMHPELDDPFKSAEAILAACPLGEQADAIIVDFHTEATSEIQGMGFFMDGRVSLVVGTHTHIPTSDQRILKGGTALMADAGMCGDFDSIIGVDPEEPLNRFLTGIANGRFTPAEGEATLCGVAIETDPRTGLAITVLPVRIGGTLAQAEPNFVEG